MTYDVQQMTVRKGGRDILRELSFHLPRRRITALVGPNGAGKTTLLQVLAGDLIPDQGVVTIDGERLKLHSAQHLAMCRVMMAQQMQAVFNLSVADTMALGLYAFGGRANTEHDERISHVAQMLGLTQLLAKPMTQCSIGQQQRVHFARALVQAFATIEVHGRAWLLLDEPTTSQDPWHQQQLMSHLHQLTCKYELGVVVVLHDLSLVMQWCNDVMILKDQAILDHGPTLEVMVPSAIQRTFGMELDVCLVGQDDQVHEARAHYRDSRTRGIVISLKRNENGFESRCGRLFQKPVQRDRK